MTLNTPRVRHYLTSFQLEKLFVEELGWDHHTSHLTVQLNGQTYSLNAFAEKRGVQIFECQPDSEGKIPDYSTRQKIEKQITKSAYEHLIIFTDDLKSMQTWQWVSRQPGQPARYREHAYHPDTHSGDSLIQKLESISFPLSEEEGLSITGVVFSLRDAFDRDRVTRRFYDRFTKEHATFLKFIRGIKEQGDREWYASLMLNRLMFVYFIQRKGFLDEDPDYLKNRLRLVREKKGKDKFLTFYRYFLSRLFHEGFAQQPPQRAPDLEELLGSVPYLNGGLFDMHELEEKHTGIDIPDKAFEQLFAFFDQYEWHLDTRPLRNDKEINPDVLGYIFEKYINQKQMGAYYTKEDITEYISKNTIIPHLFDVAKKKCAIAFDPGSALWRLLKDDSDRYIFPAVRKGVIDTNGDVMDLPEDIDAGVENISKRDGWNQPASPEYALPTETWREHVARRQRCQELREKLLAGEVNEINDFITYNLDIRQFAEDVVINCEGPELLRAFYKAISSVTVLDPTCGSGAFLFAALNILEPLYEACLERMHAFVDDLDRSGERHRPEKFSDFRRILAEIDRHPNHKYFILKSIIINNLYGVDIMEEAVEICKLRLFLKLVAQVDKVRQLEPLPDIDFNIRPGNTLVGFAKLEDVQRTLDGNLPFYKDQVKRIVEDAEIVERAFQRFHEMQTDYGMDASDFAAQKKELRDRLKKLTHELDKYLALEYGIYENQKDAFDQWRISHQPFHWFVEFYGIIISGGFDVIIGNPPYVEYRTVRSQYKVKNYSTETCGNLYAYILERCNKILCEYGRMGMIVQLPIVCTDRMIPLQMECFNNSCNLWFANFDDRPARLFEGLEHIRATIFLSAKAKVDLEDLLTTRYNRWYSENRGSLFNILKFESTTGLCFKGAIPKLGEPLGKSILLRLKKYTSLGNFKTYNTPYIVYFHNAPQYWVRATDFVPFFWNERDGEKISTQVKIICFKTDLEAKCITAVLNSSLFYWWYILLSDGRHLNLREIDNFPVSLDKCGNKIQKKLAELVPKLMKDLKRNANRKECSYKTTGRVLYDEFFPKNSKKIIDEIDCIMAKHYGFTNEELDFIVNYDIKFRMGQE